MIQRKFLRKYGPKSNFFSVFVNTLFSSYLRTILIHLYKDKMVKYLDILFQIHIIKTNREMLGFVSKYGGFCYKLVISAVKKAGFPSCPGKYSREVNL